MPTQIVRGTALFALLLLLRSTSATSSSSAGVVCTNGNGYTTITEAAQLTSLASCDKYVGTMTLMLSQPDFTTSASPVPTSWSVPVPVIAGDVFVTQDGGIGGAEGFTLDMTAVTNIDNFTVQDVNPLDDFILLLGDVLVNEVYFSNVTFQSDTFPFDDTNANLEALYAFEAVDTNLASILVTQSSRTFINGPFFVVLQNNQYLNNITLSLGQEAEIIITGNGNECDVDCGAVESASFVVSGVHAFTANYLGTLGSYEESGYTNSQLSNSTFTKLDFANLVNISGLVIEANDDLDSLQLGSVSNVGELVISGNARLSQLDLPALATLTSTISVSGPFTSVVVPSFTPLFYDQSKIVINSSETLHCDAVLRNLTSIGDVEASCATGGTSSSSAGLSMGAKVGVGVGVGVGVLVLLIAGGLLLRRRHKLSQSKREEEQQSSFKSELDGKAVSEAPVKGTETDGRAVFEVPAANHTHELSADDQRYELLSDHGVSEA